MNKFIPVSMDELNNLSPDFILVSGDAYVDHPSFGCAIISRLIEHLGFSIGIIAQPLCDSDYKRLGTPNIAFLISGGVVDSMVNNYTVSKHKRDEDVYSPEGKLNKPDRTTSVYGRNLKRLFPTSTVVIGGIEASLRRFAHYDYWSDSVMPSILVDSKADLLIYGMGEKPFIDIAQLLHKGVSIESIKDVCGTAYLCKKENFTQSMKQAMSDNKAVTIESFMQVSSDKNSYVKAFNTQCANTDSIIGKILMQYQDNETVLIVNRPQTPLTQQQMDMVYALPYTKQWHPMYDSVGGIKALEEIKFSISSQRGCFGSCNFCALTYHQGRVISNRSKQSIVNEAIEMTNLSDFKGYIHDVGGPTANFYNVACDKQVKSGVCPNKQCIGWKPCENLKVSHTDYLDILRTLRQLPKVKKVFVRSGIRFDYLMYDKDEEFFVELVKHHISGQLKVAPEHVVDNVLVCMNKPSVKVYKSFVDKYKMLNARLKREQFVVPYLISSHPGSTIGDAVQVAQYLKSINYMPEQVQDFYPTPSTKSTTMYYTGINPDTNKSVYVAKSVEEKALQRALLQFRKKENYHKVLSALKQAKRTDLIGTTDKCLIRSLEGAMAQTSTKRKQPFKLNKGKK